ncbi:hypothetical protein [Nocardia cyriacigeorgica]|uniref:Uncharacterized protein n=1 Tax=Nocardia cyriacigeorgica TaxID=135487 RepID=A0A5R8NIC6_9NOCA|nr:hypothetical protein [Nocardia cyriacigeorgica]TLF75401.1 hypothetical protein FEK34_22010 [Nocardia cyriacigeorgica]
MDSWHVLTGVVSALAGCGVAVLIVGCVWPVDRPDPPTHRRARPARSAPVFDPTAWTCGLPLAPLSLDDAHRAMQHHREHDCARKHAAFATLVAAGRITPDSRRRRTVVMGYPGRPREASR